MRNLREPRDPREEREQREERQQHDERERLERERAEHEQGRPKLTAVPRPERGITEPERSTVETAEAGVRTGDIHQNEQAKTLLTKRQVEEMRERWQSIQATFVDEPRRAVEDADALVSSAIKMISESFTDQRSQLERQWSRGEEASTETLRVALQQYRSFFSRLLSL